MARLDQMGNIVFTDAELQQIASVGVNIVQQVVGQQGPTIMQNVLGDQLNILVAQVVGELLEQFRTDAAVYMKQLVEEYLEDAGSWVLGKLLEGYLVGAGKMEYFPETDLGETVQQQVQVQQPAPDNQSTIEMLRNIQQNLSATAGISPAPVMPTGTSTPQQGNG